MKAVFFDVFGTLVDWRGGIARESERILRPLGISLDWSGFAQAWRDRYQPSLEQVRSGREPFVKLDQLHRRNVEPVLAGFGVTELPDAVLSGLVLAWHRLDGWPDAAPGLHMLRRSFLIAPVSNGEIALMVDLARHNGFSWDAILGAEIAQDYKPKPRVYLAACEAFNLPPEHCLMAAAIRAILWPRRNVACARLILRGPTRRAPAAARRSRPCLSILSHRASRISRSNSHADRAYFP